MPKEKADHPASSRRFWATLRTRYATIDAAFSHATKSSSRKAKWVKGSALAWSKKGHEVAVLFPDLAARPIRGVVEVVRLWRARGSGPCSDPDFPQSPHSAAPLDPSR